MNVCVLILLSSNLSMGVLPLICFPPFWCLGCAHYIMLSVPPTLTVNSLLADLVSCFLSLPTQWQGGSVPEALLVSLWFQCKLYGYVLPPLDTLVVTCRWGRW